ncbi:Probable O-methyltransferase 3 [Linum perenne]
MDSYDEILGAQAHIWSWSFSQIISMSIKCAVELGVPDAIHNHGDSDGGGVSLSTLISSLNIPPSKTEPFRCVMRLLTHSAGLFTPVKKLAAGDHDNDEEEFEEEEEFFSLNPSSRLLLTTTSAAAVDGGDGEGGVDGGGGGKQTPSVLFFFQPMMQHPWTHLSTWLRDVEKRTPFEIANGTASFWDYIKSRDPTGELMGSFYDTMVNDSRMIGDAVVSRCKDVFEGVTSLVDVGGGTGAMAAAVAKGFPWIKCTVLDLPHVVKDLEGDGGLEFVGGDMFWVFHDWDEENCIKILKVCKEAITSSKDGKPGKLIIIDMVVDEKRFGERNFGEVQLCFDLFMMAFVNGKERTEKQWKKLFSAAGYSGYKISPVLGPRSVIQAFP